MQVSRRILAAFFVLALLAVYAESKTSYTVSPTMTFATGPSCYLRGMICDGPGGLSRPCCSGRNVTCKAVPGKRSKYCVPTNKHCIATGTSCKDTHKPCCEPRTVCKATVSASGTKSTGMTCQKKCTPDYVRCAGAPGKPFFAYKGCCNPKAVCRSIGENLYGKFCMPPANEALPEAEDGWWR